MARSAATLMIDIAADVAKLRTGFDQAERMVGSFGQKIARIGKTIAVGVVGGAAINSAIGQLSAIQADVDRMSDTAENLKLPVAEFQAFEGAALLAGQSIESVGGAIGKLNVFLGKASEGNKEQVELLNELGIKALDSSGKMRPLAELLPEIAKAITSMENPFKRAAAEVTIFGKSGQSISAMLSQWARGTGELTKELSDLGLIHSPEVTKALAENADAADKAKRQFEVLFALVAAPISTLALDLINAALKGIHELTKAGPVGIDKDIQNATKALDDFYATQNANAMAAGPGANMGADLKKQEDQLKANLLALQAIKAEYTAMMSVGQGGTGKKADTKSLSVIDKNAPDKLAEALKKLRNEATEANAELRAMQERMAQPTAEMERQVELGNVIARRVAQTAQELKDAKLSPSTADLNNINKWIKDAETAKSETKKLTELMSLAQSVQSQWGDGSKEFAATQENLGFLLGKNVITQTEYANAIRAASDAQAEQALNAMKYAEGLEGISAGFSLAMRRMENATSAFAIGEQAFQQTFSSMGEAIREMVQTGQFNFAKLAQSFSDMLAQMAAQLAAKAAFNLIMSALGSGLSSISFGGPTMSGANPASQALPHGSTGLSWFGRNIGQPLGVTGVGRAVGGPVSAGTPYMVGENGPERFVPSVAGRIEPNSSLGGGNVTINNNAPGVDVSTQRTSEGDLLFTIEKVRNVLTRDVRRGGNPFSVAVGQAYGVSRAGR